MEVDVGFDAVAEAYAEAAVAGAADCQEFAFNPAVVVGYAYAAAYEAGEVVVAGGVVGDAWAGGGGGYEVVHLFVAYHYGLAVGVPFDVEVLYTDVFAHYLVDVAHGVVDEEDVGYRG